jgi:hypothetical protein
VVTAASGSSEDVEETVAKDAKLITSKMIAMAKEMDQDSSKGKILRVVDKMLFNYRNIGFIHLLFPQAVILHTVRDPMDTLLSCFTQKFDDKGLEWAFQPATLVEMFVDYLTIMSHFRSELPGRVLDINYEEVVRQPERVVKNLIVNKLGLPWNDRLVSFVPHLLLLPLLLLTSLLSSRLLSLPSPTRPFPPPPVPLISVCCGSIPLIAPCTLTPCTK